MMLERLWVFGSFLMVATLPPQPLWLGVGHWWLIFLASYLLDGFQIIRSLHRYWEESLKADWR